MKQREEPLISVILPFYNAVDTLNRAIESIANQTISHFECILVDNNSNDGSTETALKWTKYDSRFKIINEPKQGVTFASNSGSAVAKGEFIARMDADDTAFPYRLEKQAAFLKTNPHYGAVAGLAQYKPHKENTDGFERFVKWSNSQQAYSEIFKRRFIETTVINPTAMWRKETEIKYGSYRHGDFPEDYEMWLRWLDAGVKIGKINEPVIQWSDSDERLTRTHAIYREEAFYKIKSFYLAKWLKENNPHHPYVSVWGASRTSRKHLNYLTAKGIEISSYIDIKKTRQLDTQIIHYEDLPHSGSLFILVYIKHHGNRNQIAQFLTTKGFTEGINYLFVS